MFLFKKRTICPYCKKEVPKLFKFYENSVYQPKLCDNCCDKETVRKRNLFKLKTKDNLLEILTKEENITEPEKHFNLYEKTEPVIAYKVYSLNMNKEQINRIINYTHYVSILYNHDYFNINIFLCDEYKTLLSSILKKEKQYKYETFDQTGIIVVYESKGNHVYESNWQYIIKKIIIKPFIIKHVKDNFNENIIYQNYQYNRSQLYNELNMEKMATFYYIDSWGNIHLFTQFNDNIKLEKTGIVRYEYKHNFNPENLKDI